MELRSSMSPLFVWIREVVLGLSTSDIKTYHRLSMNWLLTAPKRMRLRFLQGLCDGDGYASLTIQKAGVGNITNQEFIQKVLGSLEIRSLLHSTGVVINRVADIGKAASLPIFRLAKSRLDNLNEIDSMLKSRKRKQRISKKELSQIAKLRRKNWSFGQIALYLWRVNKRSRTPGTVSRISKKLEATQE